MTLIRKKMIEELDPLELSRQLKKPEGETGRDVAKMLNETNQNLYDLALSMLDLSPGDELLEIGFGNGMHFSRYFDIQSELSVTGLDFSSSMCKEAEVNNVGLIKEGKLRIHCSDTVKIPLEDQSFDWIIGLNILYFWDPPGPHLEQLFRLLKPGGHLLFGYRPRNTVEHLPFTQENFTLYEPEELNLLISEYGFEKVCEEVNSYNKEAPDRTMLQITDICLLAKK